MSVSGTTADLYKTGESYSSAISWIRAKQERIKGTEKASLTPYSIGNSSRVIFNTADLKGD